MFNLIQLIDAYLSHSLLSVINPTSTLLYHIHYNILYHTLNPSLYPFISLPPTSYPLTPLILFQERRERLLSLKTMGTLVLPDLVILTQVHHNHPQPPLPTPPTPSPKPSW